MVKILIRCFLFASAFFKNHKGKFWWMENSLFHNAVVLIRIFCVIKIYYNNLLDIYLEGIKTTYQIVLLQKYWELDCRNIDKFVIIDYRVSSWYVSFHVLTNGTGKIKFYQEWNQFDMLRKPSFNDCHSTKKPDRNRVILSYSFFYSHVYQRLKDWFCDLKK